jgi:predicted alpha/beta-hydrolase family hydrolase
MLVALANAFAEHQIEVVRYDLPFRQDRVKGPPRPSDAARDREGLREEINKIRQQHPGQVWLGGQSYGGRQSSMLVAETPGLVDRLLLLSYPLHPPGKARQLRMAHFPNLNMPTMFVHGSRDPFGTLDEIKIAMAQIPGPAQLLEIEGAGHDLGRNREAVAGRIVAAFLSFNGQQHQADPK